MIIAILYCGFFVTFWSLGRDAYTTSQMGWLLVRIFFGSSYIGFDSMHKFGLFGPTLMYLISLWQFTHLFRIIFVCLTQIVLITVLISILSNQFAKYNARDQYHFLFGTSPNFGDNIDSIRLHRIDKFRSYFRFLSPHQFDPITLSSTLTVIPPLTSPIFTEIKIRFTSCHACSFCSRCNYVRAIILL